MDEYERLEAQLKELYAVYVLLFRNLSHLQQQLWEVERAERDRHANAEQTMRVAVDRMRMENNEMALGGGGEKLSTTYVREKKGNTMYSVISRRIFIKWWIWLLRARCFQRCFWLSKFIMLVLVLPYLGLIDKERGRSGQLSNEWTFFKGTLWLFFKLLLLGLK